jgi:CRP-like cAMP-binding protein
VLPEAQEIKRLFARHFMLEHLSESDLDNLLVFARRAHFAGGETLFRQGDPGHAMMVLVAGRVKIVVHGGDGRELMLAILGPGEILGEMALLEGRPRSADAVALDDCDMVVVQRRDFLPFLERHPEIAIRMLQVLSDQLRRTNAELGARRFLGLPARLAQMLLDLAGCNSDVDACGEGAIAVRLGMSQGNIAALLGVSRESINKQLAGWRRAGLIGLHRGTLTLCRPEDMIRIARSDPS